MLAAVLVAVLVGSIGAYLYQPATVNAGGVFKLQLTTDQGINPQLAVNQNCVITAAAAYGNQSVPPSDLTFSWTVTPHEDMTLMLNGEQRIFGANESYTFAGSEQLTFSFVTPATAEVWVNCEATDQKGVSASYTVIITDPASLPSYYLDGSTATAGYIVRLDTTGFYYYAINGTTGKIDMPSTTNASAIINYAVAHANSVSLLGKIILTSPIDIDNSVTISGENNAGDLFFTADSTYHGFSNKWATTIVADGNFSAFEVGKTNFVFGVTIQNLGITGKNSDAVLADTVYSAGDGIRVYKADDIHFNNIEVTRKDKGIHMENVGSFAIDNVIDVVTLDNIYLCYNRYGIYTLGWVADARLDRIWGYLNQISLLNVAPQYDWMISHVWSNGDGWNSNSLWDTAIFITTSREVTLDSITIAGAVGSTLAPKSLIGLALGRALGVPGDPASEWCRGHVIMRNLFLFETQSDAIKVDGYGQVDISNLNAGSTGSTSFYGGPGTITGCIIYNYGLSNVSINVNGGYAKSSQAKVAWFYGILNGAVQNVQNYNPYGVFDFYPFCVSNSTLGLFSDATNQHNPVANVTYKVVVTDVLVTSTGGTGVNITITDPKGNTLAGNLTNLDAMRIPVGYGINWGSFSVAPTILAEAGV